VQLFRSVGFMVCFTCHAPRVKTIDIPTWKVPVTYYISTGCDMSTCSLHFQRSSWIMKFKVIALTFALNLQWTARDVIHHSSL